MSKREGDQAQADPDQGRPGCGRAAQEGDRRPEGLVRIPDRRPRSTSLGRKSGRIGALRNSETVVAVFPVMTRDRRPDFRAAGLVPAALSRVRLRFHRPHGAFRRFAGGGGHPADPTQLKSCRSSKRSRRRSSTSRPSRRFGDPPRSSISSSATSTPRRAGTRRSLSAPERSSTRAA